MEYVDIQVISIRRSHSLWLLKYDGTEGITSKPLLELVVHFTMTPISILHKDISVIPVEHIIRGCCLLLVLSATNVLSSFAQGMI